MAWQMKLTTEKLNKALEPAPIAGVVTHATTVPTANKMILKDLIGILLSIYI